MTDPAINTLASPLPLGRFVVTLAGVSAVGAGSAAALCVALGASGQVAVIGWTVLGCLVAAAVSLLPVSWRARASDSGIAQGFVIGMMLRLVLTGLSVVVIDALTSFSVEQIGFWTAGWYLLLLTVEAALLAGHARKAVAV